MLPIYCSDIEAARKVLRSDRLGAFFNAPTTLPLNLVDTFPDKELECGTVSLPKSSSLKAFDALRIDSCCLLDILEDKGSKMVCVMVPGSHFSVWLKI